MRTPLQKEWEKLLLEEQKLLEKKGEKQQTKLDAFLEEKIPDGLQNTLDKAFAKAFNVVFTKGTGVIEKTYNREKAQQQALVNEIHLLKKRPRRRDYKAFSKTAAKPARVNTAVSTAVGVGLGVLGIGIPDIVIFVGMVLKNMYQLAAAYNHDYNTHNERRFILLLIRGGITFGEEQRSVNAQVDYYIKHGSFMEEEAMEQAVNKCAECLSSELLYMKFLQGVPIAGVIGGAWNCVYMSRINSYAKLKYHKRMLYGKRNSF